MDYRQKIAVIVVDVVVIIELCVSLYLASGNPEDYTATFFKAFFIMVIPTLVAYKLTVRRFKKKETKTEA